MFPLCRDGNDADDDVVDSRPKDEREELKSEHDESMFVLVLVLLVVVEDDTIDENDAFDSRLLTSAVEIGINSSKSIRHEDVIYSS